MLGLRQLKENETQIAGVEVTERGMSSKVWKLATERGLMVEVLRA